MHLRETPRTRQAAPKPWQDKDPAPWSDGDPDGDSVRQPEPHRYEPGEKIDLPPATSPDSDLDLRASLTAGAATCRDPEAARAMLAIEARLGEISLYMKAARAGAPQNLVFKLDVLAVIL